MEGHKSRWFKIQGCPLSPLLYSICYDRGAGKRWIRGNVEDHGKCRGIGRQSELVGTIECGKLSRMWYAGMGSDEKTES